MKLELSFLSQTRSVLGMEVERNGRVTKDENDKPIFQNTIEVTFGIIFMYLSIQIGLGKGIAIMDMLDKYAEVMDNKDSE